MSTFRDTELQIHELKAVTAQNVSNVVKIAKSIDELAARLDKHEALLSRAQDCIVALSVRVDEMQAEKAESAPEWKPCPFCNGANLIECAEFTEDNPYQICCLDCCMAGAAMPNREEAVEAWNDLPRRP